jgi:hypothetical protein
MAQQTTVRFIDDLDGSDAVGTVSFALENRTYEIDLSDENTDKLHDALAPFIEHGRPVGGRGAGRGRRRGRVSRARRRSPLVRIGRRPPRSASGLGRTVTR